MNIKDLIKLKDLENLIFIPTLITKVFGPLVGIKKVKVNQAFLKINETLLRIEKKDSFFSVYNGDCYICSITR